jgi:hypothetical protein
MWPLNITSPRSVKLMPCRRQTALALRGVQSRLETKIVFTRRTSPSLATSICDNVRPGKRGGNIEPAVSLGPK